MLNPALHLQQNDERSANAEVVMLRLRRGRFSFQFVSQMASQMPYRLRRSSRQKGKCMPEPNWKLLTKKRNSSTQGIPPGKEDLAWVTNTVTLVYGERDAILVDTFLSGQHSKELVDWVVESGKNLTTIYVTHAHGDHFFGLKLLLDRFPNARAFATASVVAAIQNQIKPDFIRSVWEPRFPGQLPLQLVAPYRGMLFTTTRT